MGAPFRGRRSTRDSMLASKQALDFYADMAGRPRMEMTIPPKRERIRRPVDGKPVKASEYQEQGAVIDWWWKAHKSYGLPIFALYSVPNGAYLASGYAGASMLKKTGMRSGTPDLILDVARRSFHGLRIEMKSENGEESEAQKEFGRYLESAGYRFIFSYGSAPAIAEIKDYLGQQA